MISSTRTGCRDVWNAYMCINASFSKNDIPFCPTTAVNLPQQIINWGEAKAIYSKHIKKGDKTFFYDAFVCFYTDDYRFDGTRGIWHDSKQALKILRHFAGVITPDFSTYQDFPLPLKLYNTYRMRAYGYWLGQNGLSVINNVRWGTEETWWYSFDGIPTDSVVTIGTVGGSPKKLMDRDRFENGLYEMVRVLHPHTILIYGSANYPCFQRLVDKGIQIISYSAQTADAFERRKK